MNSENDYMSNGYRVTPKCLAEAICYKMTDQEIDHIQDDPYKDFVEISERIMNFFGFSERIIDNILEKSERGFLYDLEDMDLVESDTEETRLYNGREWRTNYWILNKEKIHEAAKLYREGKNRNSNNESDKYSVYDDVPDGVWYRPS